MSRKSREWKEIIRHWRAEGFSLGFSIRKPTLAKYRQGRRFWQRVCKDIKRASKVIRIKIEWEEEEEE